MGIPNDSLDLMQARAFAKANHEGQMYGDKPYIFHLEQVANTVRRFAPGNDKLLQVAWLHDVIEDTDASMVDMLIRFDKNVCLATLLCSDPPGHNRKARKSKQQQTFEHMRRVGVMQDEYVALAMAAKIADRIANVSNCASKGGNRLEMYRREHREFFKTFRPLEIGVAHVTVKLLHTHLFHLAERLGWNAK